VREPSPIFEITRATPWRGGFDVRDGGFIVTGESCRRGLRMASCGIGFGPGDIGK
jgi:hypothetical protein